jgi:CubicO group peptidase (beta-lactamase class C family)
MAIEIHGDSAPRFKRLREVFAEGFRERDEIGAALAVTIDGQSVVDLWAGHADPARTRPWQRDTIANLYSTTKGMTALCAHRLVEQGRLDLDAPVASYWPEFAQARKQAIPVRWLLDHRAALIAISAPLPPEALYDWDQVVEALAAQEPWWTPGEKHGYQPVTFGWLVGEVVRRVSGRSLGTFFRDEIARPLGLEMHIGLAESDLGRVADITALPMPPEMMEAMQEDPRAPLVLAFINPMGAGDHNDPRFRRAEVPAINGHGNARALARVYGALARGGEIDGVRVLGPEAIERASEEQVSGHDALLDFPTRFGLGFMLSQLDVPEMRFGGSKAFGHPGAGGSIGFADPETRVGFGYVPNRLGEGMDLDPRAIALIEALYAELA